MDQEKMCCPFVSEVNIALGNAVCSKNWRTFTFSTQRVCISQIEISSCVCRYDSVCGSIRTNQVFATVQGAHLKLQSVCVLIKLEAHWSCVQNSSTHH